MEAVINVDDSNEEIPSKDAIMMTLSSKGQNTISIAMYF